jgi:hypothetical protein
MVECLKESGRSARWVFNAWYFLSSFRPTRKLSVNNKFSFHSNSVLSGRYCTGNYTEMAQIKQSMTLCAFLCLREHSCFKSMWTFSVECEKDKAFRHRFLNCLVNPDIILNLHVVLMYRHVKDKLLEWRKKCNKTGFKYNVQLLEQTSLGKQA